MKGAVAQKSPFAVELEAGKTYYLLLVCLRRLEAPAVLRWLAQGDRIYTDSAYRGQVRHRLPLRLQADERRSDV